YWAPWAVLTSAAHSLAEILRLRWRKSLARSCAHSFVDKPLETPAVEVLSDVDVPFAIGREGMRHVQQTAEDTLLADVVDDLKRFTQENRSEERRVGKE